jgi:hypothetical protein
MNFDKLATLVMLGALLMFIWPTDAKAQSDEYTEFCKGSVTHSLNYMSSEDLTEVLNGQLKILESEKVGDMEKFVGISMFLIVQKLSYSFEEFSSNGGTLEDFSDNLLNNCITILSNYKLVEKRPGTAAEGQTYDSIY